MPRLPTILVIGSQAISTSPDAGSWVVVIASYLSSSAGRPANRPRRPVSPGLLVARQEVVALGPPLRLGIGRLGGEAAQRADHGPVQHAGGARHPRAGRLVHERHELVREARHRARDAVAADVRAAADAVDPAPLGHVALHDRAPAAELHQALGRAVLGGEVTLLVVAAAVAALVDRGAEQPLRPQGLVQR